MNEAGRSSSLSQQDYGAPRGVRRLMNNVRYATDDLQAAYETAKSTQVTDDHQVYVDQISTLESEIEEFRRYLAVRLYN